MKLSLFKEPDCSENHVDIHFREMDDEVKSVLNFFDQKQTLYGKDEKGSVLIRPNEIHYMEVIERKSFVYLKDKVLQIDFSLRDFVSFFENHGSFVQIEKSIVVNIDHIVRITPDVNMRMNLVMDSGDKLVVNRGFKKDFMDCLTKRSKESK